MKISITNSLLLAIFFLFLAAFFVPVSGPIIPVLGASARDWSPKSFWYYPWGVSVVHKGIDIFAKEGTPVLAATEGLVVYSGEIAMGGKVVLILGSKWRFYYYAHLSGISVSAVEWVASGENIGSVGATGNAQGKPPHLHFAILSSVPMITQYDPSLPQPWRRLFYINPDKFLNKS